MPQRFLRPGIRTSCAWNKTSFGAQSLYISLLTLVDDFGRYDGRSALLHGECCSLRNDVKAQETAARLKELESNKLIQLYSVEGKEYLQVLRWQERSRSEKSKFPDPLVVPQDSAGFRSDPLLPSPSSPPSPLHRTPDALRFPAKAGDEFKHLFGKWILFRKGLGRKPKDWSPLFQEQLDWIATKPQSQWVEIVSQSIRNGWQGLFEVRLRHNGARPELPAKLDPSKIDLPERFKSWTAEHYPDRREDVMGWRTWAEVPVWLRNEWWKQEKAKLPIANLI